jgi:cation transport ATPase
MMPEPARNRNRRNPRSVGEMISTMVFFSMAGWLALEALSLVEMAPVWQVAALWICALLSFLGGLRFVIARAWAGLKRGHDR